MAFYVTGLGQTSPPSVDGAVNHDPAQKPLAIPQVTVNTFAAQPSFLGAAPNQVAGVTQINLRAPAAPEGSNSSFIYVGSAFTRIYTRQP